MIFKLKSENRTQTITLEGFEFMTVSRAHRPSTLRKRAHIVVLSTLAISLAFGCGDDDGANGAGAGGTGGSAVAPFSGAVLCTLVVNPDDSVAFFVRLVSDAELEQGEQIIDGLQGAIEVGGGADCTVQGRSVFVTNSESPTIARFDEVDGVLVEGPRVSFMQFGVTAVFREPVILSNTKAYYLDQGSRQIVIWNPAEMTTIGSIPLGLAEPAEGLRQDNVFTQFVGDLLVVFNRYRDEQEVTAPRTDFWFIDSKTDDIVATDVTEECGGFRYSTVAANGDVYLGQWSRTVAQHALELPGSFPPCLVRIRAGTREIDRDYTVDLNALTGGLPTAGPIHAAPNDRALLFAYDTSRMPIDPTNQSLNELSIAVNWDWYEWQLGTEQPADRIESIPTNIGQLETRTYDGRTFLLRLSDDFSRSEYIDLTENLGETVFTFRAVPALFARLGSEPGARMAERVEPRGGLRVLPF